VSSHTEVQKALASGTDFLLLEGGAGFRRGRHPLAGRHGRRGLVVRSMVIADLAGLLVSYVVATLALGGSLSLGLAGATLVLCAPAWILLGHRAGLYRRDDRHADHSMVDELPAVLAFVTIGTWILGLVAWLVSTEPSMQALLLFWLTALVAVTLARGVARAVCTRSSSYVQRTLIVGVDEVGELVASKIRRHPEYGIDVIGFVDGRSSAGEPSANGREILGDPSELSALVDSLGIERVIVAFTQQRLSDLVPELRAIRARGVQVDLVPRLYDLVGPHAEFHTVEGLPLVGMAPVRLSRSAIFVKRAIDVVASALGLLFLSPLFAYVAVRIKLDSPGPVLFSQERVGREGKPFRLVKFRTMVAGENGSSEAPVIEETALALEFRQNFKLRDDPRVTSFGRWLRSTSIDELPQLWNVLRGDMSLIGPRPITAGELSLIDEANHDLLAVKPGITGYWQINGRSEVARKERSRLELSYVSNWSLGLDLEILAKTVRVLASRRGAY
jgi:exopolysaccharide biosynthesis polyprenyl glycosylphosphotransferase